MASDFEYSVNVVWTYDLWNFNVGFMSFFEVSIDCNCTEESHTVLKGWTFPLINLLGLIGPHDEIQSIEFWYKSIVKPSLAKVLHLIHMSLYSRMILHWIFCIQIHHIREGKCDANVVSHWVDHIYIFFCSFHENPVAEQKQTS